MIVVWMSSSKCVECKGRGMEGSFKVFWSFMKVEVCSCVEVVG